MTKTTFIEAQNHVLNVIHFGFLSALPIVSIIFADDSWVFIDSASEHFLIAYSSTQGFPVLISSIVKVILTVNSSRPVRGLNISIDNSKFANIKANIYFDQTWIKQSFAKGNEVIVFDPNNAHYDINSNEVGVTFTYPSNDKFSSPPSARTESQVNVSTSTGSIPTFLYYIIGVIVILFIIAAIVIARNAMDRKEIISNQSLNE